MVNGVAIYGGFAGTEEPATFDLDDRDLTANETILSGDIGTPGNNADNCYHVFYHPEGTNLDRLEGQHEQLNQGDRPFTP